MGKHGAHFTGGTAGRYDRRVLDGVRLGLGCLRLPDGEAGVAVVRAALDAGVRLVDTADVYGKSPGDGERTVAAAVASAPVVVVTKVGLTRPEPSGRWIPDGRARSLTAAAEASCRRLERGALDVLLLHAPDPRVPIATSVRALAALRAAGVARAIGVSNVTLRQLDDALAAAPLDVVQLRLGPTFQTPLAAGLVARCRQRGIALLAHTPLGGAAGAPRLAQNPTVAALVARLGCSPVEAAVRWTMAHAHAIPIVGCSRPETARALGPLSESEPVSESESESESASASASASDSEVVLIIGSPGAGKSTLAAPLVAQGYARLNRDAAGGRLDALAAELDERLDAGDRRFVLDNTYPSRRSRAPVVAAAARHGAAVRCILLDISAADAQVNACERMLARHGRLLEPDELTGAEDRIPPRAVFDYRRAFEPPEADEGFASIETRPFVRAPAGRAGSAVIVDLDGIVWRSRSGARTPVAPDDVELVEDRSAALGRESRLVFGTTWQPDRSAAEVDALLERLRALLERPLDVVACRHPAGPPICWCRKPLPGLGALLAWRHRLDPAATLHVGARPTDRDFAARLGFAYVEAGVYFG